MGKIQQAALQTSPAVLNHCSGCFSQVKTFFRSAHICGGQHELFIKNFLLERFSRFESHHKRWFSIILEDPEGWSWVIANALFHVREMINPIISYKFYLPLPCSAKERQMATQPTSRTWKRKKKPSRQIRANWPTSKQEFERVLGSNYSYIKTRSLQNLLIIFATSNLKAQQRSRSQDCWAEPTQECSCAAACSQM